MADPSSRQRGRPTIKFVAVQQQLNSGHEPYSLNDHPCIPVDSLERSQSGNEEWRIG